MNLSKFPIFFWFELLGFLVSLLVFRKLRGSFLVYVAPFLFIVVAGEYIGGYMKFVVHTRNGWLYNILNFIEISFWTLFFLNYTRSITLKKTSIILFVLFISFGLINIFFIQGWKSFNNYTLITGSAILIFQSGLYFYELLKNDEALNLIRIPAFWIACGAFFFFIGTFFNFSLYGYLRKVQVQNGTHIFDLIIFNLNIVFYSCITIGLVVTPKKE
jgi:hypothetical protein